MEPRLVKRHCGNFAVAIRFDSIRGLGWVGLVWFGLVRGVEWSGVEWNLTDGKLKLQ